MKDYLVKCCNCGATQWCQGEEDSETNGAEYYPNDQEWIHPNGCDTAENVMCAHSDYECIDSEYVDPFPTPQDVRCLGD